MTSSNDWEVRLSRTETLVESNAKAIAALTNSVTDLRHNVVALSDEVRATQRQMRDILRRVDDNSADIRELILENQRILRYLESKA